MNIETYKNIIGDRALHNMLLQTLSVLLLFLGGYIPLRIIKGKMSASRRLLLSYPLGISLFSVSGLLLLITGIRFDLKDVIIVWGIIIIGVIVYGRTHGKDKRLDAGGDDVVNINPKSVLVPILIIGIAFISCSGLIPQIVSNDSVYYYSVYPSILSSEGYLSASLDKFLTDVGQATAVLESLPFLMGFDESFGIQHFLNFNFIALFFAAVYEAAEGKEGEESGFEKGRILFAAAVTLFLLTSEPFIVMSTWILSNAYYMELMFIAFFLIYRWNREKEPDPDYDFTLFFIIAMLTMCRMEGGVMVTVMAAAASTLPMEKGRLIKIFWVPLAVLITGYYVNLFLKMGVNPLYSFLDIKSALLMGMMILALLVYIILIREKLPAPYLAPGILGALTAGNLLLLLVNHERYITNLRAFISNIRAGNGWGIFFIMILIYTGLFIYECIRRRFKNLPFRAFFPAAMALTVIAVCFARGGVLAVRTSDSGNRVLMELTPVIIFSVAAFFAESRRDKDIEDAGRDE